MRIKRNKMKPITTALGEALDLLYCIKYDKTPYEESIEDLSLSNKTIVINDLLDNNSSLLGVLFERIFKETE